MDIRRAAEEDLAQVDALLEEAGLPPLPRHTPLSNVIVALDGPAVRGAATVEVAGRYGLVRSTVVAPDVRGRGLGASLLRTLVARAHELGLLQLYLLTENAAGFFEAQEFRELPRAAAPPEIRATEEFREQCPETAKLLCLQLATRV